MSATSLKLNLPNEAIPFQLIHDAFAESSHGKALKKVIRYERYLQATNLTQDEWSDLLGDEANNLDHMNFADAITIRFLDSCAKAARKKNANQAIIFSKDDASLLRLTSRIHKWGEAIRGYNDITFSDRTIEDEAAEHHALQRILRVRARTIALNEQDENALVFLIRTALKEIAIDRTSKLGKAFNAIERITYLSTALKVFESLSTHDEKTQRGLSWLIFDVLQNQVETMCTYAAMYPPVYEFLEEHKASISQAFETLSDSVVSFYPPEQQAMRKDRFHKAKQRWVGYCKSSENGL